MCETVNLGVQEGDAPKVLVAGIRHLGVDPAAVSIVFGGKPCVGTVTVGLVILDLSSQTNSAAPSEISWYSIGTSPQIQKYSYLK